MSSPRAGQPAEPSDLVDLSSLVTAYYTREPDPENVDEQEFLIESQPDVYFITDHYRGWAAVLARLPKLTAAECRLRLERAWRLKAPKALVKQVDAASAKDAGARGSTKTTKGKGTTELKGATKATKATTKRTRPT